jgi:hypothetical protein
VFLRTAYDATSRVVYEIEIVDKSLKLGQRSAVGIIVVDDGVINLHDNHRHRGNRISIDLYIVHDHDHDAAAAAQQLFDERR